MIVFVQEWKFHFLSSRYSVLEVTRFKGETVKRRLLKFESHWCRVSVQWREQEWMDWTSKKSNWVLWPGHREKWLWMPLVAWEEEWASRKCKFAAMRFCWNRNGWKERGISAAKNGATHKGNYRASVCLLWQFMRHQQSLAWLPSRSHIPI